jgi:hypothetical protein
MTVLLTSRTVTRKVTEEPQDHGDQFG